MFTVPDLAAMVHAYFPGPDVGVEKMPEDCADRGLRAWYGVVIGKRFIKVPVSWMFEPTSTAGLILPWIREQLGVRRRVGPRAARAHLRTHKGCERTSEGTIMGDMRADIVIALQHFEVTTGRQPRHIHLQKSYVVELAQHYRKLREGPGPLEILGLPIFITPDNHSWVD